MTKIIPIFVFLIFLAASAFYLSIVFKTNNYKYKQIRIIDCLKAGFKFDDGDSIFCGKKYIRILGIDTPETIHKEHGIFENQPFGPEAAEFAKNLYAQAKQILVIAVDKDKYGRTLGHVFIDGKLIAIPILQAGLAYETISFYGDNGLPGIASLIVYNAKNSPKPQFENPYLWRQKHQKKP